MTFRVYSFYAGHENFGFVVEAPDQRNLRLRGEQWTRELASQAKEWATDTFGVARRNIRFNHR